MPDLIHFKGPGGHIIGMSLPLHPTIERQWSDGELQRVTPDGLPWQEPTGVSGVEEGTGQAEGDLAAGVEEGTGEPEGDLAAGPVRPRAAAPKTEWAAYAVALGACTEEQAAALTRTQLVELATPPEEHPADPEV